MNGYLRTAFFSASIMLLAGCGSRPASNEKKDPKEQPAARPAVAVDAETFFSEFKQDSKATAKKYVGALVELSGTVRALDWVDQDGKAYVALTAGKGILDSVTCFTKEKMPWNQISFGQQVKIRGTMPEFALQPSLLDAEVIEPGKGAAPVIKSEDLAAEFTKDEKATTEKYKEKGLIITGEITDRKKNDITLKGDGKTVVTATFDGFVGKLAEPLKVGDAIKIQVKYEEALIGSSKLHFYIPLLMSK